MFDFLVDHQLNFMLILIGICGITAIFALASSSLPQRRKISLIATELSAMSLLIFDRFAYIYRGDISATGYWMVRISNFMVFVMTLCTLNSYNFYLIELFDENNEIEKTPVRLRVCNLLFVFGYIMIIISQFTGFYYTFDEMNRYQRSPGFVICYLIPVIVIVMQSTVILSYSRYFSRWIYSSLILFSVIPLIASVTQMFLYGLSLINISIVAMCIIIYLFALIDMNKVVERSHRQELEYMKEKQESMSRLFEQTADSFATAIDGFKIHRNGHSKRVADYAKRIAMISGKDEETCKRIYYAGLLHDVGKLGIPDEILGKGDELSSQEENVFKGHTTIGKQMLSDIEGYSYLTEVAHYHHERYDGSGYPKGLKGEEIPEEARIIAIADAYDNMTSRREYRGPLPQSRVREEFISGSGSKYDPEFTRAVLIMIDEDRDYELKESGTGPQIEWKDDLYCSEYRGDVSNGIMIGDNMTRVTFKFIPDEGEGSEFAMPSMILFDSLDGNVHNTGQSIAENRYVEYGEIWFDGHIICTRARNMEAKVIEDKRVQTGRRVEKHADDNVYEIEAGRYRDHALIRIKGGKNTLEVIVALPDDCRYIYMGITGEKCRITDIDKTETSVSMKEGDIPRIAEEVLYTDRIEADLRNIQIDGYRSLSTEGVRVEDGVRIVFHTRSLPTATLIWHCPYIVLYRSDDDQVTGDNYREFVLVRIDGEIVETDESVNNRLSVVKNEKFDSWDSWKERNKTGMECSVSIKRSGRKVTVSTENAGIIINNVTTFNDDCHDLCAAITGDQCALTDIRIY